MGVGVATHGAPRRDMTQDPARRIPPQGQRTGPRKDYLDAFEEGGTLTSRSATALRSEPQTSPAEPSDGPPPGGAEGGPGAERNRRGRTYTGIAAAAVTTVLAVVVAGQVNGGSGDSDVGPRSASGARGALGGEGADAGTDAGAGSAPSNSPASLTALTYEQKMAEKYPLDAKLAASGAFQAVGGFDAAPGQGEKFRYRVDVEQGLGLDAELFAQAVQKTLNDDRSWAHNGGRTFERISSGKPDFVITLASPGTTAVWCAKSGLDTTEDNVSCDSASTDRVMINAYRWAQGSETYGNAMVAYRQMLINHEVGHRLGYGHVTCQQDGALAPVMQQQTKFLDHDGIHCRANPWPFPQS